MKINQLKSILSIIFIIFIVAGCSKNDDNATYGTASIFFTNRSADLVVNIFTVENMGIPIYTGKVITNPLKGPLNFGNYVVKPYVLFDSTFFPEVGFQLNPGKKVANIRYSDNNEGYLE